MALSSNKKRRRTYGGSFDTHSYDLPSKELFDRLAQMQPEIQRVCSAVPKKRLFSFTKRVFDIVLSVIALILLSPLFLIITVAVRRSGPGGAIFRQPRVGVGGKVFVMYKFRTMVEDADAQLPSLAERNVARGPMFKALDDPRLTPLGETLRRYSVDELPQLLNILRGEMSFVGPRPPLVSEVVQYKPEETVRLAVIGGLTCSWQVHRKREADFYECLEYDKEYIEKRGLFLDLLLILQTFGVVSKGKGR